MKLSVIMSSGFILFGAVACQSSGGSNGSNVDPNQLKGSWQEISIQMKSDNQARLADVDGYIDLSTAGYATNLEKVFMSFDDAKVTATFTAKDHLENSTAQILNYRFDGSKLKVTSSKEESYSIKALNASTLELVDDKDGTDTKLVRVSGDLAKAALVQIQAAADAWQPSATVNSGTSKYTCTLNQTPVKTINRCATARQHGGEVTAEKTTINGLDFNLWAAPQTFEQLYLYDCVDACGNKHALLGDVSWDCVSPQEVAATGIQAPENEQTSSSTCSSPGGVPDLTKHFSLFLKKQFKNETLKPTDMPAPMKGINYWDGDN